jgi:hypothetical protein
MNFKIFILFLIQLTNIYCFVPNINACYPKNIKTLHNSLILLNLSVNKKWNPPEGYVPSRIKIKKWNPPDGYIPERLKNKKIIEEINKKISKSENPDEFYTNNNVMCPKKKEQDIEIEIDKILIKIEKIKNNVKNIKKYNTE